MSARVGRHAMPWMTALVAIAISGEARSEPCGDGVVDPEETCDLGIGNEAAATCTPECTLAACGDGVLSLDEACDDGNLVPGDGCGADCRDESQPRWSASIDRDAATNEWFTGVERFEDRIFIVNHASDAVRNWSSTLLAYDLDGNKQWESFFGPEPFNQIGDIAIGEDRLFVGGRRFGSNGGTEAVLAAYRHDGSIVGESPLLGIEHVTAVVLGPNGDLFLGGQQRNGGGIDRWFGRYSVADDALRWSSSEPRVGGTETVQDGAFDPRRGLFFCGELGNDAFVLRIDPDSGAILWDAQLQEDETAFRTYAGGLALTEDQVIVVGRTQFREVGSVDWKSRGWVSVSSLEGVPRWIAEESGPFPASDGLFGVAARDDGSFVVSGYRTHEGLAVQVNGDIDGLIAEYSADGTRGREVRYDGPLHHADYFYAVAVLDDDRVLAAGGSMALAAAEVGLLAEFELPPVAVQAQPEPGPPAFGDAAPSQQSPAGPHAETLYIDFDGASLQPGEDGRLEQMSCIDGPFEYPGFDGGRAFVETTVERVRQQLEPFDVQVVWETRPDSSLPYTTVLVGGVPEQLGFDESTQGYACRVDCGNEVANELVLAFDNDSEQALANTIVHEAAHAWGLDHVVDNTSLMSPFSPVDKAALLDRCVEISEATSSPVCIEEHASFCPPGEQNEHAELMARFGERRPDLAAPTLLGLPDDVVQVEPGEPFVLEFEIEDDSGNPGVELRVPGLDVRKTLDASGPAYDVYLPQGEHMLEVRGIDHAGNETVEVVSVRVMAHEGGETDEGSGTTGEDGDAGDDESGGMETDTAVAGGNRVESGCACSSQQRSDGPASLFFVLLAGGIVRRRRR